MVGMGGGGLRVVTDFARGLIGIRLSTTHTHMYDTTPTTTHSAGADAFFAKLGEVCARLKDEGGLGILVNNVGMVNPVGPICRSGLACHISVYIGQSSSPTRLTNHTQTKLITH